MTKKELKELLKDNIYIKGITDNGGICYTKEFYSQLNEKLKSMNPIEAYTSFGFDVNILGENRAYAAARRAKEKANKTVVEKEKYVDGTIPSDQMGEMSLEDELIYLRSRVAFLETVEKLKKNIPKNARRYLHIHRERGRVRFFFLSLLYLELKRK